MLRQLAPRRRIDRVADLLPAGGRRFDMKLRCQSRFLHQVLHHELGHGAAADISMTHKEYLLHRSRSPALLHFHQYSRKPPVRREKNAATPEILWRPAILLSSIQNAARLGCTTPVPRCCCTVLKSPHSASSRGSLPAV